MGRTGPRVSLLRELAHHPAVPLPNSCRISARSLASLDRKMKRLAPTGVRPFFNVPLDDRDRLASHVACCLHFPSRNEEFDTRRQNLFIVIVRGSYLKVNSHRLGFFPFEAFRGDGKEEGRAGMGTIKCRRFDCNKTRPRCPE